MSEPYSGAPQKKKPGPWAWLAIGCGVFLCAFIGFIAVVLFAAFGSLRSSTPFKEATARAQRAPRVIAALGQPIEVPMFFVGTVNVKNDDGDANLDIGLTGPKGKGRLLVVGTKAAGDWSYSTMRVEPEDGAPIDLLNSSSEGSTSTAPPAE